MFKNIFSRKVYDANGLFNGPFVDVKAFYAVTFNRVPCISFLGELDATQAFNFINERYRYQLKEIYQHAYFDHEERKMIFNNTIFIFHYRRMVELGSNYCQVLHTHHQYHWANELIKGLARFRIVKAEVKETRVIGFARRPAEN